MTFSGSCESRAFTVAPASRHASSRLAFSPDLAAANRPSLPTVIARSGGAQGAIRKFIRIGDRCPKNVQDAGRISRLAAVMAVAVAVVAVAAGVARADYLTGDPRVCQYDSSGTIDHAGTCANLAARATVMAWVAKQKHLAKWSGLVACQPVAGNVLRQRCLIASPTRYVLVAFKRTAKGWRRSVVPVA